MTRSEVQSNPKWVQLVRALAILAIVFDHAIYPSTNAHQLASTLYTVTNWWDIPLLFILGGFAIEPVERSWQATKQFIGKRLVPILGTYFGAGVLLIIIGHFVYQDSWRYTGTFLLRLIYGGQTLDGPLSLFWLFTVYLLTMVVVAGLLSWINSPAIQFLIAISMFALGISYNNIGFLNFQHTPWGVDLVLMTTLWMLSGYYAKKYWLRLTYGRFYATAGILIYFILVYCRYQWNLNFELVLKNHLIKTPFMAAWVPLFVAVALLIICQQLANTKWLNWLLPVNRFTVPIICMAQITIDIFSRVSFLNHTLILWLLGVVVPIVIAACYRGIVNVVRRS
ncbi:acyltransferase family protein [Secundilactobacillus folii]|uniref:Acyltransferase family protein n=1 Tax=Secundilactobacillus folii TaxID=2678357 RepID=A0A7X2XU78_9LACO|nr:acyltransferase [Secundilactobacillus folii]MTV81654.1 acyltransferase family protein [Secundilactobacillus folii]